jgi:hypothetical protein
VRDRGARGSEETGRDSNPKWLFEFLLKVAPAVHHKPPLDHRGPEKIGRIGASQEARPVLWWLLDERKAPFRGLSGSSRDNYRHVQTGWRTGRPSNPTITHGFCGARASVRHPLHRCQSLSGAISDRPTRRSELQAGPSATTCRSDPAALERQLGHQGAGCGWSIADTSGAFWRHTAEP